MFDKLPGMDGVFDPSEVRLLQTVFRRLADKGCVPHQVDQQREFAAYIFGMYRRGLILEQKLVDLGVVAARNRFKLPAEAGDLRLPLCRVMVVEDDYYVASDLANTLKDAGAVVVGPFPGEEDALVTLEAEVPDIALLDLNLGLGPRFEIARALCSHEVPVCVYTGYRREDFGPVPECLELAPWLQKPASKAALIASLGAALRT